MTRARLNQTKDVDEEVMDEVPEALRHSNLYASLRWRKCWRDIKEFMLVSLTCALFWAFIFWLWPF